MNVVLIGFNGDGGYRYNIDAHRLEQFLKNSFPAHRPSCLETGELLDIEHHMVYNAFHVSHVYLPCILSRLIVASLSYFLAD